jgi:hypothetical protein
MLSDPFVIFLLIIAGLYLAAEIYLGFLRFQDWVIHKCFLLTCALGLLKAKDENIRAIGWDTLKLFFWESNNDDD